jgi:hypothetical protein
MKPWLCHAFEFEFYFFGEFIMQINPIKLGYEALVREGADSFEPTSSNPELSMSGSLFSTVRPMDLGV